MWVEHLMAIYEEMGSQFSRSRQNARDWMDLMY